MTENSDILQAMGIDPSMRHVTWPPTQRRSNQFLRHMMTEHGIKTLDLLNGSGIGSDDSERIDHILSSYPSDIDFNLILVDSDEEEKEKEKTRKKRRSMSQDSITTARNILKTVKNLFHSRKTR